MLHIYNHVHKQKIYFLINYICLLSQPQKIPRPNDIKPNATAAV